MAYLIRELRGDVPKFPLRFNGSAMPSAGEHTDIQSICFADETILKAAGSSLDRVVKITVLLARTDLYKEMNEAYVEFFPGPKPARAMVRFGADIPGVLVAVEAIALV
jgi:enamine deaminase RidA (YjgF/YER057c/UK114 family)